MKRWLFNFVSGLSLLVCVTAAVMWVRNRYIAQDAFEYGIDSRRFAQIACLWDGIEFNFYRLDRTPGKDFSHSLGFHYYSQPNGDTVFFYDPSDRFMEESEYIDEVTGQHRRVHQTTVTTYRMGVRHSYLVLATLLPATWAGHRGWLRWQGWQAARRRRAGLCLTCGYDLRASKERCPECGTPVLANKVEKIAQ